MEVAPRGQYPLKLAHAGTRTRTSSGSRPRGDPRPMGLGALAVGESRKDKRILTYVEEENASRSAKSKGTKGTPSASTKLDESNATERGAVPAGLKAPRTKSASKDAAEATARPNCTRDKAAGPPRFK